MADRDTLPFGIRPGDEQRFAFENSVDLHWKLYWEIARLHHAAPHDIIDMKCFAFNAAVTAWQLTDWLFEDMTPIQRQKYNVPKLGDLQTLARKQCRAIHLCRQIATASKHRVVRLHHDASVATAVHTEPVQSGQWPKWKLVITDGAASYAALDVFEEARLYWYKFLGALGLSL